MSILVRPGDVIAATIAVSLWTYDGKAWTCPSEQHLAVVPAGALFFVVACRKTDDGFQIAYVTCPGTSGWMWICGWCRLCSRVSA